jgi:cytoskeletal protein CcmA (bactofilin family)
MSDYKLRYTDESDLDTVMAEDFFFEGQMLFEKPLLIKGRFKGDIRSQGDLYINKEAIVEAKIEAGRVWLKGTVKGEVSARRKLELFSDSSMEGNISTPELIVQSGCRFRGYCDMPDQPKRKEESNEK